MYYQNADDLVFADKIVIPGNGAFRDYIKMLNQGGFVESLNQQVLTNKKPTLGICLGMQVMAKTSYEFGFFKGLGWFHAEVIKVNSFEPELGLPNIGWEEVTIKSNDNPFANINSKSDFCFVHS